MDYTTTLLLLTTTNYYYSTTELLERENVYGILYLTNFVALCGFVDGAQFLRT